MFKMNRQSLLAITMFVLIGCCGTLSHPSAAHLSMTDGPEHKDVKSMQPESIVSEMKPPFRVIRSFHGIPIIMYHSIAINPQNNLMVAPDTFKSEMEHLSTAGYHTITFADLNHYLAGTMELPTKPVIVTFDDGYLNNYTVAYPILKKLHLKATVFVVSNFVGAKNSLTWDQIREMAHSGVFEIGAHTEHHLDLTKLSLPNLRYEIAGSKKAIEAQISAPVIAFAYPSGRFNDAVIKATSNAGFEFAVTTRGGTASDQQGLLTLHRVRVSGDESAARFATLFP